MRKITKNLLSVMAAALFLFSCGEDEEVTAVTVEKPTLTIEATVVDGESINSGDTVTVGDSVKFKVTFDVPGGVKSLKIKGDLIDVNLLEKDTLVVDNDSLEFDFSLFGHFDEAGSYSGSLIAVDNLDQESDETVFEIVAVELAITYSQILLSPPSQDNTSETFFSIGENMKYSHDDVTGTNDPVSETIDLGYYYGASDNATLSSPDAYPMDVFDISSWGTKKDTKIESTTFTLEDFQGLRTVEDIEEKLADITFSASSQSNLTAGDILSFKTADDEPISGFIYVEEIMGTDGAGDGIKLHFALDQAGDQESARR